MPNDMPKTINPEERDWDAENDADTLARADEILNDPIRLNKAKTAANQMAAERMAQVKRLLEVSGHTLNQMYMGFEIT